MNAIGVEIEFFDAFYNREFKKKNIFIKICCKNSRQFLFCSGYKAIHKTKIWIENSCGERVN